MPSHEPRASHAKAISHGVKELQEGVGAEAERGAGRIRRKGGGRKKAVSLDASLLGDLERLVEPLTRGDPESPLRWTCKSVRKLALQLREQGHQVSYQLVSELLHDLGYSLQANRKTREGGDHADRDAQFEHINAQAEAFLAAGEPVVSVDAKKKELVGDFKNGGREWHEQGKPEQVPFIFHHSSFVLEESTTPLDTLLFRRPWLHTYWWIPTW